MVIDQDVPKSDVESLVVPQSHLGPRRPNTHQSRHTKTTLSALSNTKKKGLINLGHITLADILDLGLFLCQPESVSLADFFFFALSRQSVSCYCYDCCKHYTKVFLAWGVWSGYSTKRMILLKTLQHLVTFGPYLQNMQIALSKMC